VDAKPQAVFCRICENELVASSLPPEEAIHQSRKRIPTEMTIDSIIRHLIG
jgi:hypothetical protein